MITWSLPAVCRLPETQILISLLYKDKYRKIRIVSPGLCLFKRCFTVGLLPAHSSVTRRSCSAKGFIFFLA